MIHWFIFNFVIMLVTGMLLIERAFNMQISFLPILASILFAVTLILFIKDVLTMRG